MAFPFDTEPSNKLPLVHSYDGALINFCQISSRIHVFALSRLVLSKTVTTNHFWVFKPKFKLSKFKHNKTLSSSVVLDTFQVLYNYLCLSSVQSLSCVWLFATLWTAAHQVSLSITNSRSLYKLMSIQFMMPSNHLILSCPLLLLPSIFPSIRVFSNESVLCIRWPEYWGLYLCLVDAISDNIVWKFYTITVNSIGPSWYRLQKVSILEIKLHFVTCIFYAYGPLIESRNLIGLPSWCQW